MKITVRIATKEIKEFGFTTYQYEKKEVSALHFRKASISSKVNRNVYYAQYDPLPDEVDDCRRLKNGLHEALINRSINKHFNPRKVEVFSKMVKQ